MGRIKTKKSSWGSVGVLWVRQGFMEMKRGAVFECSTGGGGSQIGQLFARGWSLGAENSDCRSSGSGWLGGRRRRVLWWSREVALVFGGRRALLSPVWGVWATVKEEAVRPARTGAVPTSRYRTAQGSIVAGVGRSWAARAVPSILHTVPTAYARLPKWGARGHAVEERGAQVPKCGSLAERPGSWPWGLRCCRSQKQCLRKSTQVLNDTACCLVGVSWFVQEGTHGNSGPSVGWPGFGASPFGFRLRLQVWLNLRRKVFFSRKNELLFASYPMLVWTKCSFSISTVKIVTVVPALPVGWLLAVRTRGELAGSGSSRDCVWRVGGTQHPVNLYPCICMLSC